jgi:hypothetical protein
MLKTHWMSQNKFYKPLVWWKYVTLLTFSQGFLSEQPLYKDITKDVEGKSFHRMLNFPT